MEPNLAGSIYVRSSIKLLHLVPFGQQTWPLLLKIEHTVKLHVFGNNSKIVNNIRVSEEKIFLTLANQKQELPLAAIFVGGMGRNEEIYRGPYIDAFCQVWFHLA
jgi:hypothetical protein